MCLQTFHLICNHWLGSRFPWFGLWPQKRLCIFFNRIMNVMAHYLRDWYPWLNCIFPRHMAVYNHMSIFEHFFTDVEISTNRQIDYSITIIHGFVYVNYYSPYIQRNTRIRFWSPLCLSHDLNDDAVSSVHKHGTYIYIYCKQINPHVNVCFSPKN